MVGKTKLSAFAGAEAPPCNCIDYFPPWNPRGDGYQGPSGSSSGAAASVAGYAWLDHSLCTDSEPCSIIVPNILPNILLATGSVRFPASAHGVWGIRISWNMVPMDGIVPASPYAVTGTPCRRVVFSN